MKKTAKLKRIYKNNDKTTIFVYVLLRILIIICLIRELMNGNSQNAMLCVLSLFLFTIPAFIEEKFKIDFPGALERTVYLFIFSAEILGEINNFYGAISFWDTMLHTINGFLCASIGFSLVYLLNEKTHLIHLSPLFIALVSFCFSMTVGVVWEFYEYGVDVIFKSDMQKDEYLSSIRTVTLDPEKDNNIVAIDGIKYTILYDKNNEELIKLDGYLDIGLHDTMEDLIVNFVGALVFSFFGYLHIINEKKYKIAGKFLTKRVTGENSEEI